MKKLLLISLILILIVPIAAANYWTRSAFWFFDGSILNISYPYNINIKPQNFTAENIFGTADTLKVNDSTHWGGYSTSDEWLTPAQILDVDKEDIESDLNTFVDIAGDTMTGDLNMSSNIITEAGASDFTTLNTGQGAQELYGLNTSVFVVQGNNFGVLKSWWDNLYCKLTGCSMTGTLNMNGNDIIEGGDISASSFSGVSAEGNVLYMNFDDTTAEDTGTLNSPDRSPFESNDGTLNGYTFNHGTRNGGVEITESDGKYGYGAGFADNNIETLSSSSLNLSQTDYTSCFWLKHDGMVSVDEGLIGNTGDFFIRDNNYAPQSFLLYEQSGVSTVIFGTTWAETDWVYFCVQRSGDNIYIYKNGELAESNTTSGHDYISSAILKMGYNQWNGSMDEVRIWNKALTEAEINLEMESSNPVKGDGLVASHSFEQHNSTTALDTNHLVKGKIAEGMRFDGTNDYIDLGYNFSTQPIITISAWINSKATAYQSVVGNAHGQFGIFLSSSGNIHFVISENGVNKLETIFLNYLPDTWYYLTGVYNGSSNLLYVNGVLESTINGVITPSSTGNTRIGMNTGGSAKFNGSIDEVAIYNRSLTADEITNIYNRDKKYFTDDFSGHIGDFGVRGDVTVIGGITATDYYSEDGTQGYTGSCDNGTTLTVKDGLITGCS